MDDQLKTEKYPVEKVEQETLELAVIESMNELVTNAGDINDLFRSLRMGTKEYEEVFLDDKFNLIDYIYNNTSEKSDLKSKIKDILASINSLNKEIKKLDSHIKKNIFSEAVKEVQTNCEILNLILLIKEQSKKREVPELIQKLDRLYASKYGEISIGLMQDSLNRTYFKENMEKLRELDLELYNRIASKTDKYLNENIKPVENYDLSLFEFLVDEVILPMKTFLPSDLLQLYNNGSDTEVLPARALEYVKQVIEKLNNHYNLEKPWRAELNEDVNHKGYSVNQAEKVVNVGHINLTIKNLVALIFHEVFVHAHRNILATENNLSPVLGYYEEFEESLASIIQQLVAGMSDSIETMKTPYPVIIAMRKAGVDPKDLYMFLQLTSDDDFSKSRYQSWMYRTHKGSIISGGEIALFTKDLVYSQGKKLVVKLLNAINSANSDLTSAAKKVTKALLLAKFDAMNYSHILYLKDTGIIDFTKDEFTEYVRYLAKR